MSRFAYLKILLGWSVMVLGGLILMGCTQPLPACTPMPSEFATNLRINNITVIQGTPINENTPLVLGRSTAVRVALTATSVTPIFARLHVCAAWKDASGLENSVDLTEQLKISGMFTVPVSLPTIMQDGDTLNLAFIARPPNTTPNSMPSEVTLVSWLEVTKSDGTVVLIQKIPTYKAIRMRTPLIRTVAIEFSVGVIPTQTSFSNFGFAQGVLPVYQGDPDLYAPLLENAPFACPLESALPGREHKIYTSPFGNSVVSDICTWLYHINTMRNLTVTNGHGVDDNIFVYGWLSGNPIANEGNGAAHMNGRVALGNTAPERGQRTFAHELLHNLGFCHATSYGTGCKRIDNEKIGNEGWDVGNNLMTSDNFWLGNAVITQHKPKDLYELMLPGKLTNEAWVSTETYTNMLGLDVLNKPPLSTETKSYSDTLTLTGCAKWLGGDRFAVRLFALNRYPWPITPIRPQLDPDVAFSAEFTTQSGQTISTDFDPRIGLDSADPTRDIQYGFFSVLVPYDPTWGEVSTLTITSPSPTNTTILQLRNPVIRPGQGLTITAITVTQSLTNVVSTLDITAGQSIQITSAPFTLTWSVSDTLNRNRARFEYQVIYSYDNAGRASNLGAPERDGSWVPVAVNLPGPVTTIPVTTRNASGLCRSQSGVLRIFANDGFNTVQRDVNITLGGDTGRDCFPVVKVDGGIPDPSISLTLTPTPTISNPGSGIR